MIPKYVLEKFAGGLSQAAFVELVCEVTNYKWSRPSLSYMIEYGVVTEYEEVTKKANAERPRLILGVLAFIQVLIFLLMRESMLFLARGTTPSEKDASQKSSKKNDTGKYKLVGHALKFTKSLDNKYLALNTLAKELDDGMAETYINSSNYLGFNLPVHNGKIDEKSYQELKCQFIKVVLAYLFFDKLLNNGYLGKDPDINLDWNYLSDYVFDPYSIVTEVSEIYRNDILSGCSLLTNKEFMDGIHEYYSILQNSNSRDNSIEYNYSKNIKNNLLTLSKIACRFDTPDKLMSKICYDYVLKMELYGFKTMHADYFAMISRLILLSTTLAPYPSKMKGSKDFI